MSRAG